MNYQNFLEAQIRIAPKTGFDIHPEGPHRGFVKFILY